VTSRLARFAFAFTTLLFVFAFFTSARLEAQVAIPGTPLNGAAGTPYYFQFTASDNDCDCSPNWLRSASGQLPSGLTFNEGPPARGSGGNGVAIALVGGPISGNVGRLTLTPMEIM